MRRIDLNCDMGEGFGIYRFGTDDELMKYITSANIACGFHAGDASTIRQTVTLALKYDVAIGAHPGFPDLAGFGRREMKLSPQEIQDLTIYQLGAVQAIAAAEGGSVTHVKPHGALYNMATRDRSLADAIATAVYKVNPQLLLFGLSGSELINAGEALGLKTIKEVFADRSYEADGSLTSRSIHGAVIADSEQAAAQAVNLIVRNEVRTRQGTSLQLQADTICIHGDTLNAAVYAQQLRESLEHEGVTIVKAGQK